MNSRRHGLDERLVAEIPHLRRYARALTHGHAPAQADDLVKTCLEQALARADTWDPAINLRVRLFAIIHNSFVSALRRPVREHPLSVNSEAADRNHARQENHMEVRAVSLALDHLPLEQREAIVLVALEGMTYDEVSYVMQVPVGTVRFRLSRGREALRRAQGQPAPKLASRAQ